MDLKPTPTTRLSYLHTTLNACESPPQTTQLGNYNDHRRRNTQDTVASDCSKQTAMMDIKSAYTIHKEHTAFFVGIRHITHNLHNYYIVSS